jgi:hypothetical protein
MAKIYRGPITHAFKAGSPVWNFELAQCGRKIPRCASSRRETTCRKCLLVMRTEAKKRKKLERFWELAQEMRKLLE